MHNPRFLEVFKMVEHVANRHAGEIDTMKLEWAELKDQDGDVYQIVPLLDVVYK